MEKTFELTNVEVNFKNFIHICFNNSDYFSFTQNFDKISNAEREELIKKLNYCLVENIKVCHWYCYYVTEEKPLNVFLYKCNDMAKEIISNYFDNIFLNKNGFHYSNHEDICFYYGNELLLGTVSHAEICHLYPKSIDMQNEFFKIAKWKEIDFLSEELINI